MTLTIPTREGPRPKTYYDLPHHQLDQIPPADLYARLVERFLALPDTTNGHSLISVPGARALFVAAGKPCNAEACLRGREFAHLHPPEDGSSHMLLSVEDCELVLARGWGELHPLAARGRIPSTTVLVYAPRNEAEVDTVLAITRAAQRNAMTEPNAPTPRNAHADDVEADPAR
jgi:hypothetical protein